MLSVAQNRSGQSQQINIDRIPDQCPICLRGVEPLDTGQHWVNPGTWVEIVFRCPRLACDHNFIARYQYWQGSNQFRFYESVPLTVRTSKIDDIINNISPDFVSGYREAEEAEIRNLKLVCGPGYRKALEFLIKDYLIRLHPDEAVQIKKLFLGKCISDFVKNDKVNKVAARAVWLGNDETHYLRKWGDKDLQDLKGLIALTVHWIAMEELTEKAIKEMPESK